MKLAALLFFAGAPVLCAISFQYSVVTATGEAGPYRYLKFIDSRDTVTYMPPKGWECSGSRDKLRLIPRQASNVDIYAQVRTLPEPMPVEGADLQAFEQLTREWLPKGATNIEIASIEPALQIDGHPTLEVVLSYNFFGGHFKASYLYLSRGKDLIHFHVSCAPAEFAQYRQTFHASLHTLAGL
jgi:hypothetical protein